MLKINQIYFVLFMQMLADLLQEVAELKRTIEKNEKVLLKKSYWESHLSRKIEKLQEENKNLKEENKKLKEERDKYYAEWHLRHS